MALATFALTEALVEDPITPIVAAIVGEPDFAGLTFTINGSHFRCKRYQELKGVSAKTRPSPNARRRSPWPPAAARPAPRW
jgi:hypothetical protein